MAERDPPGRPALAQKTNINFVVVPDDGAPSVGGANQEGDPNHGDIRIGGYAFGSSTLAFTNYPPSVNNFSIAGDINFNTSLPFNIGSTYDLETVAAHEFGHALGLGESSTSGLDVMYPTYNGIKLNLAADDIAGIQSIYSSGLARTPDNYLAQNSSFATAANLNSTINLSSLTALQYNLDIATAGQAEFFSVDAPTGSSGLFAVTAQSLGLSLLTPKITVYASDMVTVLGSSTGTGYSGSNPTVALSGVTAGEQLFIKVQGANTTQMGTGNYALGMSFNAAAVPPTEASPIIAYPNGTPLQGGGGSPDQAQSGTSVSYGGTPSVTGISPDTGASSADGITNVNRIVINGVAASNETVMVYLNGTLIGSTMSSWNGLWSFNNMGTALADGTYILTAASIDSQGTVSPASYPYAMTIDTAAPVTPAIVGLAGGTSVGGNNTNTDAKLPILFGTAAPYSQVTLYCGGYSVGSVVANGNGNWNWVNTIAPASVGSTYTMTAQSTDIAGNVSSVSATYSVTQVQSSGSSQAPTVSGVSLAMGSIITTNADGSFTTIATPTVSGIATANSEVAVFDDGVVIGVALVGSSGTWSFTCTTLSTGRQYLTFEDVNQVGTFSAVASPITIQV